MIAAVLVIAAGVIALVIVAVVMSHPTSRHIVMAPSDDSPSEED